MFIHRQRMEARTAIAVKATMRIGGRADARVQDATLTNASTRGVLALVASPPARGTSIVLEIDGHLLKGQVRWRGSDRCGIVLKGGASVLELIEGEAVPTFPVSRRLSRGRALDIFRAMLR